MSSSTPIFTAPFCATAGAASRPANSAAAIAAFVPRIVSSQSLFACRTGVPNRTPHAGPRRNEGGVRRRPGSTAKRRPARIPSGMRLDELVLGPLPLGETGHRLLEDQALEVRRLAVLGERRLVLEDLVE